MDTNFFNFTENLKSHKNINFFSYTGWSGLQVVKLLIPKSKKITNSQLDEIFPHLVNKEKIFISTENNIEFKSDDIDKTLNNLDAVDIVSKNIKYEFYSLKDAFIFMISSSKSDAPHGKSIYFNFKKDLEARNLWGGQIISRPYEGKELTVVLFDLKPGFKFEDKGHANEQITWLTEGEMDFYSNDKKKLLKTDIGVSIGPNHLHGGVSGGALGFDAFYPKRNEDKYKTNTNK